MNGSERFACQECEAEYRVSWWNSGMNDAPTFCPFCGYGFTSEGPPAEDTTEFCGLPREKLQAFLKRTPDGSQSPKRDASDVPWEPAPSGVPQTEAEAVEELTDLLGEVEQVNRDTAADLRELGLLTGGKSG